MDGKGRVNVHPRYPIVDNEAFLCSCYVLFVLVREQGKNNRGDRTMDVRSTILALENAALSRWCAGDPSGFLDISTDDVVYFDPFQERRVDGWEAVRDLYEGLRGVVDAPRFEMIAPLVQAAAEVAVLTYNFNSWCRDGTAMR